ncbi:hypothetical protein L7F22_028428 [Adiantum nelumboides]|nr:hypothetical protein [Adiantum nelumboides]
MEASSTKVSFDLGPDNEGESLDKAPDHQLLFLKFQFENDSGAKIYKEGMERYCVKVENRRGEMSDMVPIIYSGDQYFDDQGFMYIVVLNPIIIDKWEMIGIKEKVDVEPEEAPPTLGDVPDNGEPDEQPEVEENEEILVPEQILAHKDTKNKGKVQRRFLVKFKNYLALDAKWMEEEDLANTPQIVNLYLEAFGLA